MADRNWAFISSGATFESFATTLIFFEDPGAALFGRRGKDGGQDARSSDGTHVYQAKHHIDASPAKAIADAKKEAAKIAGYRTPGHSREPQWQGVTHWHLVTNAHFNPTDKKRWEDEVVPLFSAQGLVAEYWGQAELDALLEKHPEVDRAYFQNETRAFLSLSEFKEMLPLREPFLGRDKLGSFIGREAEIDSIKSFLNSDKFFLEVHGAGGVGKTRLVVEAGERIASDGAWQVLWANVASMETSSAWFDGIVPERSTFLIVDEPENDQLLRLLTEQIQNKFGRTSKWKIAIVARSPKDPVLNFLHGPRISPHVEKLSIEPLPVTDAELICLDLIGSGSLSASPASWKQSASKNLAALFGGHPVWLTLAVHSLETSGDLSSVPQESIDLADSYLSEVESKQSEYEPEKVRTLLRWVAILGAINREDNTLVGILTRLVDFSDDGATRVALKRLVERKVLIQRGARDRFVELKPDVLRDHILHKWLVIEIGYGATPFQPSDDATSLAMQILDAALAGSLTAVHRAILVSLARTEFILQLSDQPVDLLGIFIDGVIEGVGSISASGRMVIADVFVELASYRPHDTVRLSRAFRSSPCSTERIDGLLGELETGSDDVVLRLGWPVFHAAFGAQNVQAWQSILLELFELAEVEFDIAGKRKHGLPNDGKRAKDLIGRTIEGGPQYWQFFDAAVTVLATQLLEEVSRKPPTDGRKQALKSLLLPALSLERRQTWTEDYTFHMRTSRILPTHPAWKTREAIVTKIKALLVEDATPLDSRMALWPLLAEAHRSLNQCQSLGVQEDRAQMRQGLLDDLTWAHSVLSGRVKDLREMSFARELWLWHVRFEKDEEIKNAATALEQLYQSNSVASEFEKLLVQDDLKIINQRIAEKAQELAVRDKAEIDAFIDRAMSFFGGRNDRSRLLNVAWDLGTKAPQSSGVQDFIKAALANAEGSDRANFAAEFAAIAASLWIAQLRHEDPSKVMNLVHELVDVCGSDIRRISLFMRLYGQVPRHDDLGKPVEEEYRFVRSLKDFFIAENQIQGYMACVGWGIDFEWIELSKKLELILDVVAEEQMLPVLSTLVDVVFWGMRKAPEDTNIPDGLGIWLLDQLMRIPDIGNLGGNLEWHIDEILKQVGKAPLSWLPAAIRRRHEMETKSISGKVRSISYHMRLTGFVTPIGEDDHISVEVEASISELLDLVPVLGSVGYNMCWVLHDVDPFGRVVPNMIVQRFEHATDQRDKLRLGRVAGAFGVGSSVWRQIAYPVLKYTSSLNSVREQRSFYFALTAQGFTSWSGVPGEVPESFVAAVESAKRQIAEETEQLFVPFWEWRLDVATSELRDQEEEAKEERGE